MTFRRAIPKCTPDQQARQDRARELGCIACALNTVRGEAFFGGECGRPEIHHLTKSGRQIGQNETVCLGAWHHRAILLPHAKNSNEMTMCCGPSLAKGSKPFHARYGSNEELLAYQNKLLDMG